MAVDFSSKIKRVLYQSRFCEQENFDVVISGSTDVLEHTDERKSFRISSRNLDKIETIYHSKRHLCFDRTFCERSNVWTVCARIQVKGESQIRPSFRIYLDKTDQWINVIQVPDDRTRFSACSFMKNIYVFGGCTVELIFKSCYKYDTKSSKWKVTANMNDFRQNAACTVFQGKIVLTGGWDGDKRIGLSSVEAYDCYENKWDLLPCMINKRSLHGSVCMGNKLFVIGGNYNATCEVFDSSSMKFSSIKQLERNCYYSVSAVSVGGKILIFCSYDRGGKGRVYTYFVDGNELHCEGNYFLEFQRGVGFSKLFIV